MGLRILKQLMKSVVVLTMLLSLSVLGFGPRTHAEHSGSIDAATLAFLNAGGDLSDICEDGGDESEAVATCPVCTLANGFHMPSSGADNVCAPQDYEMATLVFDPSVVVHRQLDHSRSTRAPPSS